MADQDLDIQIRTLADLTGIELTKEQLNALQRAAAEGNKDAIAALKKLSDAEKEAASAAREAQAEFVSGIRAAAGYGLLLGGSVAKAINDVAAAQNKATKEIDKQFNALVKDVQQWDKLARAASNATELAGVGEKALAQIDKIHSAFQEANEDSRTLFQSMIDTAVAGFKNAFTFGGDPTAKGPFEKIQENQAKSLALAQQIAEAKAGDAIADGLAAQAAFEHLKNSTGIDEAVQKTTDHLEEQKRVLDSIDPRKNLQPWITNERIIERINKELAILIKLQEQAAKAGQPTTTAGILQKQAEQLSNLPRTLTPLESAQARDAFVTTRKELRDQQIEDTRRLREQQAEEKRRRYEEGFPGAKTPLPGGPTQIESNKEIITWLQRLYGLWQ